MDLITDLDPHYYMAYLFSGMGLIHDFDDVKRAVPILEKGMRVFPDSWELPFWIGYDHYTYFNDYETAAKYLMIAAQKPGAPKKFFGLLFSSLKKTGNYEHGIWVLDGIMENITDEGLRTIYGQKRDQLKNLLFLQNQVTLYFNQTGAYPDSLSELINIGMIEKLPLDPFHKSYIIDEDKKLVVAK